MSRKHKDRRTGNPLGRPTKFDDLARQKIRDAAAIGANVTETCYLLDISRETYYNWKDTDAAFFDTVEILRSRMPLKAKENIAKAINEGSVNLSQWLLEKKDPEFMPKSKIEHSGAIDTVSDVERTPDELEALAALRKARRARIEQNIRNMPL